MGLKSTKQNGKGFWGQNDSHWKTQNDFCLYSAKR